MSKQYIHVTVVTGDIRTIETLVDFDFRTQLKAREILSRGITSFSAYPEKFQTAVNLKVAHLDNVEASDVDVVKVTKVGEVVAR